MPSEKEQAAILSYSGNAPFNETETFFKGLSDIPSLAERAVAWKSKIQLKNQVEYFKSKLQQVNDACMIFKENKKWQRILSTMLAYYNIINGKDDNSLSYAFKLEETLASFPGVMTSDGTTTLLRIMMLGIAKNDPELLKFKKEVYQTLDTASKIAFLETRQTVNKETKQEEIVKEGLNPEMEEFEANIKKIPNLIQLYENNSEDNFSTIMKEFMPKAQQAIEEINKYKDETNKHLDDLVSLYQANAKNIKEKPHGFFTNVMKFIDDFDKAHQTNEKIREEEEEKIKKEKQKLAREQKKKERKEKISQSYEPKIEKDSDIVSDTEQRLKSGATFIMRQKLRRENSKSFIKN